MARKGNQRSNQSPLSAEVGAYLKRVAINRGLENRQLALLSGLSEPSLTRTFTKGRVLDLVEFESLCRALGLSPWRVMRQAEQELATNHDTPPITEEFIQNLQEGLATGKYAYAAKPHTPDPYDTIGQESQIPANWEE